MASETDLRTATFGTGDDPALLLIFGLGNRVRGTNERWFARRLAMGGYRVTAVELPTDGPDFHAVFRDPVQSVCEDIAPNVVIGHSLGGLVMAHLDTEAVEIYCSPWWGFHPSQVSRLRRWLIHRFPIRRRVVPATIDPAARGARLTVEAARAQPDRLTPAFLAAIDDAQQSRPPIDDAATVFVSLSDEVIGTRCIGDAVSADQIEVYQGGHEVFSAAGRERIVGRILDVAERVELG
jgi:hypothetical protein